MAPPSFAQPLLSPTSIALVGASDDPGKTSSRPLRYLRQAGYQGTIYPINARRPDVAGEKAWRSLSELPARPDHAFILTPTEQAIEAVEECAALGIPVATILAAGFSDAGGDRIARLRAACDGGRLRLLGPSSLGAINLHHRTILTANAAFAEPDLPVGGTFVASHSGSMLGALISRGKARNLGFAGLVSVGNEVDLSLGEICAATLDDPNVTSYMLFLESLRNADDLREFALGAAARGKAVAAYKLGRSLVAAELALSHTGALAGEDDVAEAFLADCGIARVENFETLLEVLPLLERVPIGVSRGRKPRVGVLTTTGGGAAMIVDGLATRGVDVVSPSHDTFDRITATGVDVQHERIVDLTLAGTRYDVMKASLDAMLAAPEFDLVVAVTGSSARFQPDLAVRPVLDCAKADKPLASFLVPDAPDALTMLAQGGVPSFRTPEACADAIAAAFKRRRPQPAPAHGTAAAGGRQLDELEAYALLDELGVAHAPSVAIDVGATSFDLPFGYPVAVKALSAQIAHKTNVGGVALNIANADDLRRAIARIAQSVVQHCPDVEMTRVLVQPMSSGLGEVLLGYRIDRDVGPIILLAAGGIYTEIYRDRSIRLAPVDLASAHEMIDELASSRIFKGFRNRPRGDLGALARAIVALSNLARQPGRVVDAEINPLLVRAEGEGVVAVDALVQLGQTGETE
ncbi:MAG: acetate--CoA ligase family protein [Rhodopseudomonas palustris]|uniref:Acetate--CoA ligase family protein n=1 Tax=Rhodopseudomonas palustris TaxID=1076 RepID=A0A933S245_RHOPL|nr:acetate--CoA ligase family protein [Rhodopseudomonas palustris]